MMKYLFSTFCALLLTCSLYAEIPPLALKVMERLKLHPDSCHTDLICIKALPHRPGQAVVVIPAYASRFEEEGYMYYALDGHIAVADTQSGRIWYYLHQKASENGWESMNPEKLYGLYIDTAPYILAPGVRAFGIRAEFHGPSQMNPHGYTLFSLYLPQNATLKPLLNQLQTSLYSGERGQHCAALINRTQVSLIMSEEKHEGFFDIILNREISESTYYLLNGECEVKKESRHEKQVLRYQNGIYK